MTNEESQDNNWLKSNEIRKKLKISTCELAHLRDAGKLLYGKKGNAYLYLDDQNVFRSLADEE